MDTHNDGYNKAVRDGDVDKAPVFTELHRAYLNGGGDKECQGAQEAEQSLPNTRHAPGSFFPRVACLKLASLAQGLWDHKDDEDRVENVDGSCDIEDVDRGTCEVDDEASDCGTESEADEHKTCKQGECMRSTTFVRAPSLLRFVHNSYRELGSVQSEMYACIAADTVASPTYRV